MSTIWGLSARLYAKMARFALPPFVMRINGVKYIPLSVAEALMIERDRCARKFVAERTRRKALEKQRYFSMPKESKE